MHETGRSGPVHWDDPEGWSGEGGGRGLQDGGGRGTCAPVADHVIVWQKPLLYCKVIILQLKLINLIFFKCCPLHYQVCDKMVI